MEHVGFPQRTVKMVGHLCRYLDCCKKVILYQLQDKAEHQAVGTN